MTNKTFRINKRKIKGIEKKTQRIMDKLPSCFVRHEPMFNDVIRGYPIAPETLEERVRVLEAVEHNYRIARQMSERFERLLRIRSHVSDS